MWDLLAFFFNTFLYVYAFIFEVSLINLIAKCILVSIFVTLEIYGTMSRLISDLQRSISISNIINTKYQILNTMF